jgi:hypothetical protein
MSGVSWSCCLWLKLSTLPHPTHTQPLWACKPASALLGDQLSPGRTHAQRAAEQPQLLGADEGRKDPVAAAPQLPAAISKSYFSPFLDQLWERRGKIPTKFLFPGRNYVPIGCIGTDRWQTGWGFSSLHRFTTKTLRYILSMWCGHIWTNVQFPSCSSECISRWEGKSMKHNRRKEILFLGTKIETDSNSFSVQVPGQNTAQGRALA